MSCSSCGWVLIEQAGLPIPAIPLLLASAALAGQGRSHLAVAMLIPALMYRKNKNPFHGENRTFDIAAIPRELCARHR